MACCFCSTGHLPCSWEKEPALLVLWDWEGRFLRSQAQKLWKWPWGLSPDDGR